MPNNPIQRQQTLARSQHLRQPEDPLGLALRQMFAAVLDEEIPLSFFSLLDEISQRSKSDDDAESGA